MDTPISEMPPATPTTTSNSPMPMSPSSPNSTMTGSPSGMGPPSASRKRISHSPPLSNRTPPMKRRRTSSSFSDVHSKTYFHLLLLKTTSSGASVSVIGTFLSSSEAKRAGRAYLEERIGDADMEDAEDEELSSPFESGKHLDEWKLEANILGTEYKLSLQAQTMPAEVAPQQVYAVTKCVYDTEEVLISQDVMCLYRERERANARARQILREASGVSFQVRRKSLGGKQGVEYEEFQDKKKLYTGRVYPKKEGRHRVEVKTEEWELC